MEIRERPPPILEMLMAGRLGGADKDSGARTTDVGDVNSGTPRWRYRRLRSAHILC
jgi:hypothetical protein